MLLKSGINIYTNTHIHTHIRIHSHTLTYTHIHTYTYTDNKLYLKYITHDHTFYIYLSDTYSNTDTLFTEDDNNESTYTTNYFKLTT